METIKRRTFLKGIACLSLTACGDLISSRHIGSKNFANWETVKTIVEQTTIPVFKSATYDIRDYGAVPNSEKLATDAINRAITACNNAGGGHIRVSGGTYKTGAIRLKSNVNLHIEAGSVLKFSTNPAHYLPAVFSRWEGVEYMGYSPLIYAFGEENIAITGKGKLDGSAAANNWWAWKGNDKWGLPGHPSQNESRKQLFEMAEQGIPPEQRIFAQGHSLRPPLLQPYRCKNILIQDITITNSPFWLLNPVLSENVSVKGVHFESLGPNSDGCNPESCRNVVIENCYFDTGDDCIAIKSGRNNDGRRVNIPCENIVVRQCKMRAGHGGIVIGSEISGGVRNVFAEDNTMSSPDLERGFRIKTNSVRGGLLENIHMRNCEIGEVQDAIVINFHYEEGDAGQFDPIVKNISIENLSCKKANRAFLVKGFERAPIKSLSIKNCRFEMAENIGELEFVESLSISNVIINGEPYRKG